MFREGCKKEYSCNFIVAPKEGHVVSINVQEENSQANAYLYYYKGSKAKEDMIYVSKYGPLQDYSIPLSALLELLELERLSKSPRDTVPSSL